MDVTCSVGVRRRSGHSYADGREVHGGVAAAKAGSRQAEPGQAGRASVGVAASDAPGRGDPPATPSYARGVARARSPPGQLPGTLYADGKGSRRDPIRRACSDARAGEARDDGEGILGAGGTSAVRRRGKETELPDQYDWDLWFGDEDYQLPHSYVYRRWVSLQAGTTYHFQTRNLAPGCTFGQPRPGDVPGPRQRDRRVQRRLHGPRLGDHLHADGDGHLQGGRPRVHHKSTPGVCDAIPWGPAVRRRTLLEAQRDVRQGRTSGRGGSRANGSKPGAPWPATQAGSVSARATVGTLSGRRS